jgi:hypothetical protein
MSESETLDKIVEDIKTNTQKVNDTAKESEDVKNGNCTLEEEEAEPGRVLFNKISETVVSILSQPDIAKVFVNIGKNFGEGTSKDLTVMMAMCMSESAYKAIMFYDEMLSKELAKSFNVLTNNFNILKSTVDAHTGTLDAFRGKIANLEKASITNSIKDDIK